jgi:hypothetical protein
VFDAGVNPALVATIPRWQPPRGRPWRIAYLGSVSDADFSILADAVRSLSARYDIELLLAAQVKQRCRVPVIADEGLSYFDFARFATGVDIWAVPYGDDPYYDEMAAQLKVPVDVASGRPVAVTTTRTLRHTVAAAGSDGMLAALDTIMSDPAGAEARSRAAREHVLHTMTWEDSIGRILEQLGPRLDVPAGSMSASRVA